MAKRPVLQAWLMCTFLTVLRAGLVPDGPGTQPHCCHVPATHLGMVTSLSLSLCFVLCTHLGMSKEQKMSRGQREGHGLGRVLLPAN